MHSGPGSQSQSLFEPNYDSYLKASRRSFFLLLAFDFAFVGLLWLIYCTTRGYSLKDAYVEEIQNYDINSSLFDVVVISLIRLIILYVFYLAVKVNHWFPITLVTFLSSSFLIAKVVLFAMKGTHKVITDYLILIISFMIVWIQTWYLEVKIFSVVKSQEFAMEANLANNTNINNAMVNNERRTYGSIRNSKAILSEIASFYSPMDSPNDSGDEENPPVRNERAMLTQADMTKSREYEIIASQLLNEILSILGTANGWKLTKEVVPPGSDTKISVFAKSFNKIGKVFKVEAVLPFSEKYVLKVLRDDVEDYTRWNLTIKLAKVIQIYNESLKIVYIVVKEQAGGLVTSRDFVNLSKYCFHQNKHILAAMHCPNYEYVPAEPMIRAENGPSGYIVAPLGENQCQITCLINVNLKGWLPQYLIDQTLSAVQVDFITDLTKHLHSVKNNGLIS